MLTAAAHVRRHWAVFLGLVVALAIWCDLDVSRRARINPARADLHMTDLTVYTEAGLAFFDGREPYEVSNIRGWRYLYPPLFALLIAPLGKLAPQLQASVWFAISALMAFGIYFECRRLCAGWVERSEAHRDGRKGGIFSFPGSAWERTGPEALPRLKAGGGLVEGNQTDCSALGSASRLNKGDHLDPLSSILHPLSSLFAGWWASLRSTHPPRPAIWICIVAGTAALFPALNCLQRGQMGVALLYFLLLGFRLVMTGQRPIVWFVGGAMLALPVVLKLTPLLPTGCALLLVFIAAAAERRRLGKVLPSPTRVSTENSGVESGEWRVESKAFRPLSLSTLHSLLSTLYTTPPAPLPGEEGRKEVAVAFWSTAGCLAGGIFFLLLFPAALIGWNSNLRHLRTWYEKVATKVDDVRSEDFGGDVDSPRNQSLSNAVYRCGNWLAYEFGKGPYDRLTGKAHGKMPMDAPLVSGILLVLKGLALAALLIVTIRAARSGERLLWGAAFGLAAIATLVVSPVARGHYYVFLLPAVLFLCLWLIEQGKIAAAVRMALVPALLVVAHYALLNYAGRIGLLGIGTTLWYFTACARVGFAPVYTKAAVAFAAHGSRDLRSAA